MIYGVLSLTVSARSEQTFERKHARRLLCHQLRLAKIATTSPNTVNIAPTMVVGGINAKQKPANNSSMAITLATLLPSC